METQDIQSYITTEEATFRTTKIPITKSKDWNMAEHIERCKNAANGWYNSGNNDGTRPYDDLITPIIDVAFRSEGFDVKDIVPFVDDEVNYYKSFFVKKFHPKWARENQLDTLIDTAVESSIIYDLVIFKNINDKPEVVPLETLAFCDQTDVLSGPICIKHQYSIQDLLDMKGKWDNKKIDEAIIMARQSKPVKQANDKDAKTPGKYIEIYELHGMLPETWLDENGSPEKYANQLQIVNLYAKEDGTKDKIILYKGKEKKLTEVFDALKIDQVRSHGRACGKSIVERLLEPQVWNNYSAIKIKKMLDNAINILQTDSDEIGGQKLNKLPDNTIIKHEPGKPITRVDGSIQNMDKFMAYQSDQKTSARMLGSTSEASLGMNPSSGTPFKLQDLIVQQGMGIHEYRQGKIATFFSDRLYKNWILKSLVSEINKGNKWLDDLTLEEMQYIAESIATKEANKQAVKLVLEKNPEDEISQEEIESYREMVKQEWMKGGNKRFIEVLKDEFKDLPIDVFVNIAGKQKYLPQFVDKLTNIIRQIMANPVAFQQSPGLVELFNQLIEYSGLNPVDFTKVAKQNNNINQPQPEMAVATK